MVLEAVGAYITGALGHSINYVLIVSEEIG